MAGSTDITDVYTRSDAKTFVSTLDVSYDDLSFKSMIFDDKDDDAFLLITKRIGSKIVIADVRIIDDDLIAEYLVK